MWDGLINLIDTFAIIVISIGVMWLICAIIVKFQHPKKQEDNIIKSNDKVKLVITDTHAIEQIQILQELQDAYNNQIYTLQETVTMQEEKLQTVKSAMNTGSLHDDYDKLSNINIRLMKSISDNNIKIAKLKKMSDDITDKISEITYNNISEIKKGE